MPNDFMEVLSMSLKVCSKLEACVHVASGVEADQPLTLIRTVRSKLTCAGWFSHHATSPPLPLNELD